MTRKIRVAIVFGGRSAEHEISLQSAKNIVETIDRDKYELILIGIDKIGKWYLMDSDAYLVNAHDPKHISLAPSSLEVAVVPTSSSNKIIALHEKNDYGHIDVAFPVLHGPYGEDGGIQGMLKMVNVPYVGADILGSAVGMDKEIMKRLLLQSQIAVADYLLLEGANPTEYDYDKVVSRLGVPFFVKPANMGSSVGVTKVKSRDEFVKARDLAFQYDRKILIEEFIKGREIECSVLGNENPIAATPGEIVTAAAEFYSYDAKYIDANGAKLIYPAELDDDVATMIKDNAVLTYKTLCCKGMARVDAFLTEDNRIIVNEINTIPGFTNISMYPKLWEISGICPRELLDRLIDLALEG